MNVEQSEGLKNLLLMFRECEFITEPVHAASLIGNVAIETGFRYHPLTEIGPRGYFEKYDPPSAIAKQLGNTQKGEGWKFRGRGYIQLTGKANYNKFDTILGMQGALIENVELANDPRTAFRIMEIGCWKGLFTGHSVKEFFTVGNEKGFGQKQGGKKDNGYWFGWYQARRVVNGIVPHVAASVRQHSAIAYYALTGTRLGEIKI